MVDTNCVNYNRRTTRPVAMVHPGQYNGKVRVHTDVMTTDGTQAVGDKLFCGQLEPGATYLRADVIWTAMGADTTLILGDAGDADRYLTATAVAAAGSAVAQALTGVGYINSTISPIPLFLTVGGAALATGQTIRITVYSTRE